MLKHQTVDMLMYKCVLIFQRGCTALLLACQRRHTQIAHMLLHAGAHMDIVDKVLYLFPWKPLLESTAIACLFCFS